MEMEVGHAGNEHSGTALTRDILYQIFESAPDAKLLVSETGHIVELNGEARAIFGFDRDELIGQPVEVLVPTRMAGRHFGQRADFLASPRMRAMGSGRALLARCKDGREFPVDVMLSPFQTEEGCMVIVVVRDVSEQKLAELALRESETRYRLVADNASDVIYTLDLDFHWTYVSPSILRQQGWTPDAFIQQPLDQLLTPASLQVAGSTLRDIADAVAIGDEAAMQIDRVMELDNYRADGSLITCEVKLSVIFDERHVPVGIVGVSRDITVRKQAEIEKEKLQTQLRHAQKMEAIGTLAGGVAHDFNNLLAIILGSTELLLMHPPGDDFVRQHVENIDRAAMRAKEVTSQLLAFSRKTRAETVPVEINSCVDEVISLLKHTLDKNIGLERALWLDPLVVCGDSGQIHQILLNLAVNARDAMPAGGILRFETHLTRLDDEFCSSIASLEPGHYVKIVVSDTGRGISPEKQTRIFEPFFTDKPAGNGTGMGLTMVYGAIRSHGGHVNVWSEEHKGASFSVYLPCAETMFDADALNVPKPVTGHGRILIVDDEEMLREVAVEMLSKLGYTATAMSDGESALEYFVQHADEFDAAIVDMIMPGMDGRTCIEGLLRRKPGLPVVMTTGFSQKQITDISKGEGRGFLQKPYGLQQLSEAVARILPDRKVNS